MVNLRAPPLRASEVSRRKISHQEIVIHRPRQIWFGEDVLQPFFVGEVVDAASLGLSIREEPLLIAVRALGPVCVSILPSLHLGVGGVPVSNAHVYTNRDGLQCLQAMSS